MGLLSKTQVLLIAIHVAALVTSMPIEEVGSNSPSHLFLLGCGDVVNNIWRRICCIFYFVSIVGGFFYWNFNYLFLWFPQTDDVRIGNSQPTYEYQLVIWPTDIDDIFDSFEPPVQNDEPVTIIDQPVVVMPGEEDYEQDDELDNDEADNEVPLMPEEDQIPSDNIQVLENYHKTFANGSEEYK